MKKVFFLLFITFVALAHGQTWQQKFYMTNQKVNAIAKYGNNIYLSGSFTYTGPNEGGYTIFDSATRNVNSSFPKIYFYNKMVEDGYGGWFVIGQNNLEIGGQVRNRLAHIYANGYLSAWNPNPDADITDLKVSGGKVFVAGAFNNIGGQTRRYLAALDTATGTATSWNANIDQTINTLAVSNSTVYVSGPFTFIAGQVRGVLAAFDITTAQITSWDPSGGAVFSTTNPDVKKMEVYNDVVYVSGSFTSIGSQSRNGFAAIDATTGSIKPWNPGAPASSSVYGPPVQDWAIKNNLMYVTGNFGAIGGQTRTGLAALDLVFGSATSWNPILPTPYFTYTSNSIAVNGNTVYVGLGGDPDSYGAGGRWILPVNITTGAISSWSPFFELVTSNTTYNYGGITALAAGGGKVFAAGKHNGVNGQTVTSGNITLDATTGALIPQTLQIGGSTVSKFLVSGSTLYAIGSIGFGSGQFRKVAAFNLNTGQLTSWDPNPNNTVTDIATSNGIVYLSGSFTSVGGQVRNYLAAIDSATGLATAWAPVVNTTVDILKIAGSSLYVAGGFTTIGGQARSKLASFDLSTGAVSSWNPNPNNFVNRFASNSTALFISGNFTTFDGQPRNNFAAIDIATANLKTWSPGNNLSGNTALSMAANDSVLYIGGSTFTPVDAVTGAIRPWNYQPNGAIRLSLTLFAPVGVYAIELNGNQIYTGGVFTKVGNYSSPCFAVFGEAPAGTPLPLQSILLWAQEKSNTVLVNWQVNKEDNIVKCEVEKSSDGRNFIAVGTVLANDINRYQLTDPVPFSTNFYRIKAITKYGTIIYSKVVRLNIQGKGEITIYPNPIVNNELQLQLNNIKSGNYLMKIYNLAGQKLIQKAFVHQGISQTIVEDVSKVGQGVNIITLTNENGEVVYKERWAKMK